MKDKNSREVEEEKPRFGFSTSKKITPLKDFRIFAPCASDPSKSVDIELKKGVETEQVPARFMDNLRAEGVL